MKFKLVLFLTVLALALCLCACGNAQEEPTAPAEPTVGNTVPVVTAEPTDPGLFVPEVVDPLLTLPEGVQGMVLPDDEFGDDVVQIFESHPVTEPVETDPVETDPVEDTEPTPPTFFNPDALPDHEFE